MPSGYRHTWLAEIQKYKIWQIKTIARSNILGKYAKDFPVIDQIIKNS